MPTSGGVLRGKVAGVPVPIVIVAGVAAGYLLYSRYKSKGAAATASSPSSGSSGSSNDQQTAAALLQASQQQAQGNQQLEQAISSDLTAGFATLEAQIAQMFPAPSTSNQPAPAPAPAPAPTSSNTAPPPAQPGMGIVQTSLGPMVWLGVWGKPMFQVGGGAPVYFGNAQNLQQGPQAEIAGNDVYTPVAYASLVSSSPS